MKRLKDLEISVIKPKCHYSNKDIDSILECINQLIYFYYLLYINNRAKEVLIASILKFGNALNSINITVGDKKLDRRNEILDCLREYYKKLKSYVPDDNQEIIKKMNQFLVSQFIREKKDVTDLDSFYVNWLQKTKRFAENFPVTDSLKSINKECIDYFMI